MLQFEYDIKKSDIQQLSNTDAVVRLFTALGYNIAQKFGERLM
jgi:hypothetical protein